MVIEDLVLDLAGGKCGFFYLRKLAGKTCSKMVLLWYYIWVSKIENLEERKVRQKDV